MTTGIVPQNKEQNSETLNGPFLFGDKGTPAEYRAGLELAIARGWLELHDSGTYVKFTAAGADLLPEGSSGWPSALGHRPLS